MELSTKFGRAGLGCLGGMIAMIPIGLFLVTRLLYLVTGEPYFNNAWDRAKLRRIAEPYECVCNALRQHHSIHGEYPETVDNLDKGIDGVQTAIDAFNRNRHAPRYYSDGGDFHLYVKLNWDGGLHYHSGSAHWRYDPGNGDPDWPIR